MARAITAMIMQRLFVPTATTRIIPMIARLMATMGQIGLLEACLSGRAPGSMAAADIGAVVGEAEAGVVEAGADAVLMAADEALKVADAEILDAAEAFTAVMASTAVEDFTETADSMVVVVSTAEEAGFTVGEDSTVEVVMAVGTDN